MKNFILLNKNIEEFANLVANDEKIDWSEGGLWTAVFFYQPNVIAPNTVVYLGLDSYFNNKMFVIECLSVYKPEIKRVGTLSIMKVLPSETEYNGVKEKWWDLHIRDMSQNPNDPVPALLIRAKDFNLYEIIGERDSNGTLVTRETLADFIKWKENQEKK